MKPIVQSSLRKTDAERLADHEQQYRTLFEAIDVGFCIIQMLFDEQEQPQD